MSFDYISIRKRLDLNTARIASGQPELPYIIDEKSAKYCNQCINCYHIEYLAPCPDCGCKAFIPKRPQRKLLLECVNCKRGLDEWTCKICRTENLTSITFGTNIKDNEGCSAVILLLIIVLFSLGLTTTTVIAKILP